MSYARHTMTTVDPSNYHAIMSIANSDDFGDFSEWSGLALIRVVRVGEDRFLTTGGYKYKGSADANADKASAVFAEMASLMTSAPVVREGEIVWAFDGDQSLTVGYVRHVIFTYDPERYEAMKARVASTTERFRVVLDYNGYAWFTAKNPTKHHECFLQFSLITKHRPMQGKKI